MTPDELLILRRNVRLTQGDLALRLGISRQTINRWELGKREIPSVKVDAIVAACIKPAPAPPNASERKTAQEWLDAYRTMRRSPQNRTHKQIISFWMERGADVPDLAKEMIRDAFPDITNNGETK